MISTVDPETDTRTRPCTAGQDGFKAHLAIEPDTGLITDCALTKASGADRHEAVVGLDLLAAEDERVEVLADSAYGTGQARAEFAAAGHTALNKPIPRRAAVGRVP